jgi:site-specific recombinase XerD
MTTDLQPTPPGGLAALADLSDRARAYAVAAENPRTMRARTADWAHFTAWCAAQGIDPFPTPPAVIVLYTTAMADAGFAYATIERRVATIRQAHAREGIDRPTNDAVQRHMRNLRVTLGTAQKQATPATVPILRRLVDTCDTSLMGIRDRALLLLGFAGALRRSELVGLEIADLEFTIEGLVVTIRRSKTDQEGRGRQLGIPYGADVSTCPVRSVRRWIEAGGLVSGGLWPHLDRWGHVGAQPITDRAVALIVKRHAQLAGLDPAMFSGHSLRAGLATAAAEAGLSALDIAEQTGHRSLEMVKRYVRRGSLFRGNVSGKVGL